MRMSGRRVWLGQTTQPVGENQRTLSGIEFSA